MTTMIFVLRQTLADQHANMMDGVAVHTTLASAQLDAALQGCCEAEDLQWRASPPELGEHVTTTPDGARFVITEQPLLTITPAEYQRIMRDDASEEAAAAERRAGWDATP